MLHAHCLRAERHRVKLLLREAGFTLIELAVGLFILTLLIATLLSPLTAQIDQRRIGDTQSALNQITEALTGYAVSNGYLPCPDRTTAGAATPPYDTGPNDGAEDRDATNNACKVTEGNLPWATLGIPPTDAWGNYYRYQVTAAFAARPTAFTLASQGTLSVKCPSTGCPPSGVIYATTAPAVVMSHGKNGWGAINGNGNLQNPTTDASADELQNVTHTIPNTYYLRTFATGGNGITSFDDIVVWLSTPVLMSRMVAAQKLP